MTLLTYRKALVAIVAAALFSNLSLFLMNNGFSPVTDTQITLALAAASLPLLLEIPRRSALPRRLIDWCLGFLAISMIFVVGATTFLSEFEPFRDRIFGIFFVLLMLLIFSDPGVHRFASGAIGCVLIVSLGLNLYEAFNPGTFSLVIGRSAGLYENPNQTGAALILALILAMETVGPRARIALAIATLFGVALTFSRSALFGWVVVSCTSFSYRRQFRRFAGNALMLSLGIAALILVLKPDVVGDLQYIGMLNRNTEGRASMELGTESDGTRVVAAQLAMEAIADNPIVGLGTGASSEPPFNHPGPHNTYLSLMVDHGVLGIFILPLFLAAATRGAAPGLRAVTVPFTLFLAYWGLFSHNVLQERYILIAVSLVASMVAAGASGGEAPEESS